MTRLRPLLAALVVALPLLVPLTVRAVWQAGWTIGYLDGRCWAAFCLVHENGYTEASWNEYPPPQPATVPVGGAPVWGVPPATSAGGSSAGP